MKPRFQIEIKNEQYPLKAERFARSVNNLEKHLFFKKCRAMYFCYFSKDSYICKMYLQTGRVMKENSYYENTNLKSLISWKDEIKKAIE